MVDPSAIQSAPRQSRLHVIGVFILFLVALQLSIGHRVRLTQWHVQRQSNSALDEAVAWKDGRLHITENTYEVARVGEHRYNVVGLAFVLISLVGTTLTELGGGPKGTFHAPFYVLFVAMPLVVAAFATFREATRSTVWGAVLAGYLFVGTSLLPVLEQCRGTTQGGSIYFINHALAVTGLLIMCADLLGPRKIWPALIGLALAAWSRQMTMLYALPLLWIAWRTGAAASSKRPMRIAVVGVLLIALFPMTLNYLKFGNPFDTGYSRIYEGRTDPIGRRGQEQLFGLRYLADNAWAMNAEIPSFDIRRGALQPVIAGRDGASIWFTTPLLIGILVTLRKWWADATRRALVLGSLPVIAGLLLYHVTGSNDAGHFRYALDFIPVWFIVIAPFTLSPRGKRWTLACLAFSATYFSLLP
ncbi:hypothetical protein B7486_07595 [cyanobacterium TDX16]|nr:hypothetical protein B7486_07595 [cyanobacterium TDX16]